MSRKGEGESTRDFITGLVVLVATILGLVSFARISLSAVVVASAISLIAVLAVSWVIGERKRRGSGTRPR